MLGRDLQRKILELSSLEIIFIYFWPSIFKLEIFAYQNRRMGACRFGKVSQRIHQRRCTKHAGNFIDFLALGDNAPQSHCADRCRHRRCGMDSGRTRRRLSRTRCLFLGTRGHFLSAQALLSWQAVYIRFGCRTEAVCAQPKKLR